MKKQDKKYLVKICELLAVIGIIANTMILLIIRETVSYEEVPLFDLIPTPKSTYLTIILYNPALGIVYFICGIVLLCCGIYRILKYMKSNICKKKGKD